MLFYQHMWDKPESVLIMNLGGSGNWGNGIELCAIEIFPMYKIFFQENKKD